MSVDYKDTVFLPQTEFPMRAGLPKKEPEILARWRAIDLYARQREVSAGREKFVLHDGPPYANGNLHIGHALNKILKDVINRSQQMLGKDANYVPGWDCHGLPIEWKVEETYRAAGQDKDAVPIVEFRQECREFADKWIAIQSGEFQRLGVIGDWARPYTTMNFHAEAQIAREISRFVMNGGLYRGTRPVLWSVVEKTALADAEVEYEEHTSPSIHVRFPVIEPSDPALAGAAIVIWTTTPWTIPGNRAIAVGPELDYLRIAVEAVGEKSRVRPGDEIVLAQALLETACKEMGIEAHRPVATMKGAALAGTVCAHPLAEQGFDHEVPVLPAGFVTTEQGTGFVHIAPSHGEDDFHLGREHGLPVPDMVDPEGRYYEHVPLFAGMAVLTADGEEGEANGAVMSALEAEGALLGRRSLKHQYPHSWRSKAPLIFRNTAQWFISMETNDLRAKALAAIAETRFVPPQGQTRLRSMIETRPDWCISRQRAWGVPIPVFVEKATGAILRDEAVYGRIVEAFEAEGGDAWFSSPPARFLGPDHDPDAFEQVRDIADVWFDSGSTHAFVLEERADLKWPASLYLEGSDQHRGWFHSSLLEACGTRGRAPYEAVLTHGFVMAEDGRKMSKSLGNVVAPQTVVEEFGADILRIWVVSSDYSEDLRIGPEIIKHQADLYRRIRNTLRFLLGSLAGFEERERLPVSEMPELERWVLHRIRAMDEHVRRCADDFAFHSLWTALHNFCAVDLSAFYFDIRKDSLYCDAPDSARRRACRTVLDELYGCLTAWLAPILCFTAEEAWMARGAVGPEDSVHLRTFPEVPAEWRDDALAAKWEKIRKVRRVVTNQLELARAAKTIGSSLEAVPTIFLNSSWNEVRDVDWAEVCITSSAKVGDFGRPSPHPDAHFLEDVKGVEVEFALAEGRKCARCWQVLPDVGAHGHSDICGRCAAAVDKRQEAAE